MESLWAITEEQNRASKNVFTSFLIRTVATVTITSVLLLSCKKPTETNSQAAATGSAPVDYSSRIGVAVRTASRTCAAIKNRALQGNSAVTLVLPVSPQSFVEARVSGPAANPCPITKEAAPETSNYEISLPASSNIPELTPMIAVAGSAAASTFLLENISVQADLDQTRTKNTFRACGANDGIHLTVWRGIPVTGTRVWSGYYYEAGNPGTLPACTPAELPPAA